MKDMVMKEIVSDFETKIFATLGEKEEE